MEKLFTKLKLKTIDEFYNINKETYSKHGGQSLVYYHYPNHQNLLKSLYPNYPWNFEEIEHNYYRNLLHQLYLRYNLQNIDEYLLLRRSKLQRTPQGKKLLQFFQNDYKELLKTLFPNHQWKFSFDNMKFRPSSHYHKTKQFSLSKLRYLKEKYFIVKKNDWYRLPIRTNEINLFKTLRFIYPNENWVKSHFLFRYKQANQRLLFGFIQSFYPSYFILENYFHPHLSSNHLHNHFDQFNNLLSNVDQDRNQNNNIKNDPIINFDNFYLNNLNNNKNNNVNNILDELANKKLNLNKIENINNNNNNQKNKNNKIKKEEENRREGRGTMEVDIFIPSLNKIIEYQGRQHYDDLPSAFSQVELYQSRDQLKEYLCKKNGFDLIVIPYWWDQSPSSLFSFLQKT